MGAEDAATFPSSHSYMLLMSMRPDIDETLVSSETMYSEGVICPK